MHLANAGYNVSYSIVRVGEASADIVTFGSGSSLIETAGSVAINTASAAGHAIHAAFNVLYGRLALLPN